MKSILMKTFATGIVASTLLLSGCSKAKDGAAGPAGATGATGVVPTSTDGFIKGTIAGTKRDGSTFNYNFNFTNYYGGFSGTMDSLTGGGYNFAINRQSDVFGSSYCNFTINSLTKAATTGMIMPGYFSFNFTQSLGNNQEFSFSGNTQTTTITVYPITYNTTTKLYTGSMVVGFTAAETNTGHGATITISFQATITQLVYFNHHTTKGNVKE